MSDPIVFTGLTLDQANATAQYHSSRGATVNVTGDGTGLFNVEVRYASTGTGAGGPNGGGSDNGASGDQEEIAWGKKVSAAFKMKVIAIGTALGCVPSYLMAAMAFETGDTFSPTEQNCLSGGNRADPVLAIDRDRIGYLDPGACPDDGRRSTQLRAKVFDAVHRTHAQPFRRIHEHLISRGRRQAGFLRAVCGSVERLPTERRTRRQSRWPSHKGRGGVKGSGQARRGSIHYQPRMSIGARRFGRASAGSGRRPPAFGGIVLAIRIRIQGTDARSGECHREYHSDRGAKISVTPDGSGLFSVKVVYPAAGTVQTPDHGQERHARGDNVGVRRTGRYRRDAERRSRAPRPLRHCLLSRSLPVAAATQHHRAARRLDPSAAYIACRWDYSATPKDFLKSITVVSRSVEGQVRLGATRGWGPNASRYALPICSRAALHAGLATDDECAVIVPLPAEPAPQGAQDRDLRCRPVCGSSGTGGVDELNFFGDQTYDIHGHITQLGHKEGDDGWYQRVGTYWLDGTNTRGVDGQNHDMPWSAAFVSWVMKTAGAGDRFPFDTAFSVHLPGDPRPAGQQLPPDFGAGASTS